MRQHIYLSLLAGVSLMATGAANAQSAQGTDASAPASVEDIIVTGSRVTTGANSPTPMTVLPAEQFTKLQSTTITEAINLLPALQGSQNVTSRPGGGQRNGAGAYFNLRNMGNLRTLVLMDGMRVVPTINQNGGDTDASIVPQLLIKRVDVVTGGVSAVYGSDAVSGVINFVTDRDFNGLKLQVSQGVSNYGDDPIFDIGIAGGTRFANDRGHIELSYQFHRDAGILSRVGSDRDFFAANIGGAGNGSTVPYYNIPDQRISNTSFGGLITTGPLNGKMFDSSGQLVAFQHGLIPTTNGLQPFGSGTNVNPNVESGGSGAWYPTASLKAAIEFHQAFGRLDYDLTDDIHAYAQLGYSWVHTYNNYQDPNVSLTISNANPLLRAALSPADAALLTPATGTLTFNRLILGTPRAEQFTEGYMSQIGLEGSLGSNFNWNIGYGKSQSTIEANNLANLDRGRLAAATDVVDVGQVTTGTANGQVACRAAVAYSGHAANPAYAGCVPFNIFGEGRASQQAMNYVYQRTYATNRTRLDNISGSITGTPFDSWAGPVRMALSGEWRRTKWNITETNASPTEFANCTGITYNCTATTTKWFFTTQGALDNGEVTQTVKEAAYEVNVPLMKDVNFFKSLSVTGAVRYTDYNLSGSVWTWKVGGEWSVSDDLRFRATRSRDIRAPNLFDLFTSTQIQAQATVTDPLTGAIFTAPLTQNGNPTLTPEKADTLTIGAVFTPRFLPGFTFSVDYYKIKVRDVIYRLAGNSAAVLRYCLDLKGASPVCSSLITRNNWTDTNKDTNPITATRASFLNIASMKTWGLDFESSYHFDAGTMPVDLRVMATYSPKLAYDVPGGNDVIIPKWKATAVASISPTDNLTLTALQRWRASLPVSSTATVLLQNPRIPSVGYTTLNLSFKQDTKLGAAEWYVNVANVFNKFATVYYAGPRPTPGLNQGLSDGDDPIGRYFTVGFRLKM